MARYTVQQYNDDIDTQMNRGSAIEESGTSKYPGMTYEQGVKDALEWVIWGGEKPLPDDDFKDIDDDDQGDDIDEDDEEYEF